MTLIDLPICLLQTQLLNITKLIIVNYILLQKTSVGCQLSVGFMEK